MHRACPSELRVLAPKVDAAKGAVPGAQSIQVLLYVAEDFKGNCVGHKGRHSVANLGELGSFQFPAVPSCGAFPLKYETVVKGL